ncbi:hypothetical protein [Bradyrhizobium sp. CCBAU 51765]|uniref:hypothetical protein n=1 Tax=Bradyrhizobium sp. CCBAU 51765 TaxID=1325102 RepID=UPI001888E0FD|nr:hypothetical protein [Bradyrhizobium sp. CCBAU 51765]
MTVASMRKLLKGILPSGYAGKVGKARQQSFKDAAAVAIKNIVGDMDLGEIVSMTARAAQKRPSAVKVDYLFEMRTARTVAVMTVGPYRNATMYRDRAEEWSLRAFGITWFYDVVVLVLPGPEEAKVYRQRVHQLQAEITQRKLSTPAPRVEVTHIFVEPFGPEYSAVGDLAP